jgi:hypothetical protein
MRLKVNNILYVAIFGLAFSSYLKAEGINSIYCEKKTIPEYELNNGNASYFDSEGKTIECSVGGFIINIPSLKDPESILITHDGNIPYTIAADKKSVVVVSKINNLSVDLVARKQVNKQPELNYISYSRDVDEKNIKVIDAAMDGRLDLRKTKVDKLIRHQVNIDNKWYDAYKGEKGKYFVELDGDVRKISYSKVIKGFVFE